MSRWRQKCFEEGLQMYNTCMELLRVRALVGVERQNVEGEDSNRTAVSSQPVANRFQVVVLCKTGVALGGGMLGVNIDTINVSHYRLSLGRFPSLD